MSVDKSTTKDLMEILADGRDGFAKGAAKIEESSSPGVAVTFRRFSDERSAMYDELEELAQRYGDDLEESSSVVAAAHRGWMSLKDALSGSSPKGVIEAAEQGEDHAVSSYKDALEKDLSTELRAVVQRQFAQVKAAHDEVRTLKAEYKGE